MKALVKVAAQPGLALSDVPEPVAGRDEVLVRVLRTGICGTDLHIAAWDAWAQRSVRAPLVVGHEFVGEIVEVGAGVEEVRPGDVVGAEGHIVCRRCRNCRAGRGHLCHAPQGLGVQRNGVFAEYAALPASSIWVHRGSVDLDVAAIFDPFGNAVHSALSFPVVGEDVLVTGAGPIGLMAAMVARHAGARRVVITDVNEARLHLARRVGVTRAVNVTQDSLEAVRRELGVEDGFGVGLEMSGAAPALRSMVANMAHGGSIALLGLPHGEQPLDLTEVIQRMLTIRGIYGREIFRTWQIMSELVGDGLDIGRVITHRLPYQDYQTALDLAGRAEAGKVILQWGEPAGSIPSLELAGLAGVAGG